MTDDYIERLMQMTAQSVMPDNVALRDVDPGTLDYRPEPPLRARRHRNAAGEVVIDVPQADADAARWDRSGPCKSSRERRTGITATELAFAAADLLPEEWQALQLHLLGETSVLPSLVALTLEHVREMAEREEWVYRENVERPRLKTLAMMAVIEMGYPELLTTAVARADFMGLDLAGYRRRWAGRYRRIEWPAEWLRHGMYGALARL